MRHTTAGFGPRRTPAASAVHKANPLHHSSGAVVPLIIGDSTSVFSCLPLVEYIGMLSFFAPKDRVTRGVMQRLDVGGVRTETVFGDDALAMRVIVAPLGHE